MKYCTGALVIVALLGVTSAIHLKTKAKFSDDLVKSLAEDMQKDVDAATEEPAKEDKPIEKKDVQVKAVVEKKTTKKTETKKAATKKVAAKKAVKKEVKADDEIPMDAAAIKAYSSVIADAAEDSEPSQPVIYHQVAELDDAPAKKPRGDLYNPDPMGSMIQNEISSIKDASIKAAKERDD